MAQNRTHKVTDDPQGAPTKWAPEQGYDRREGRAQRALAWCYGCRSTHRWAEDCQKASNNDGTSKG